MIIRLRFGGFKGRDCTVNSVWGVGWSCSWPRLKFLLLRLEQCSYFHKTSTDKLTLVSFILFLFAATKRYSCLLCTVTALILSPHTLYSNRKKCCMRQSISSVVLQVGHALLKTRVLGWFSNSCRRFLAGYWKRIYTITQTLHMNLYGYKRVGTAY